ncbi:hypothetical protein N7508_010468 [Penicillium antarcticum]|uniref:uncharacterized protein n=1 Tax=Penicillium antarcticum TaxID=416450 RepID=UPI0023934EEB|nr:uncharacterized protein N7508_010468 [Penicillium antarcticum]KAJ5295647.1 hypothetical protein N7508_010468 [Penicillium antarcticum]
MGVGELSALNAIAGAFAEYVPVIHIVAKPGTNAQMGRHCVHHTLGDGDFTVFEEMSRKVSCLVVNINNAQAAPSLIDEAIRTCWVQSRPVTIFIDCDMVQVPIDHHVLSNRPLLNRTMPSDHSHEHERLVDAIVNGIRCATNPVILVGGYGILHGAKKELDEFLRQLELPILAAASGLSIVDASLPYFSGLYVGSCSSPSVLNLMESVDLVISIGNIQSDLSTSGFRGVVDKTKLIEIERTKAKFKGEIFEGVCVNSILGALSAKLGRNLPPTTTTSMKTSVCVDISHQRQSFPTSDGKIQNRQLSTEHISRFSSGCELMSYLRRCASFIPSLWSQSFITEYVIKKQHPITHDWLWVNLSKWLKQGDIILTETGTSSFGIWNTTLPADAIFIAQYLWSSIGYTIGACEGAALAARDSDKKHRRTILFIGDGSFQCGCQELSTIIRHGLNPIIFIICNNGYTVERLIHGQKQTYNDIQPWDHRLLPAVFGAAPATYETHRIETTEELEALWRRESFTDCSAMQKIFKTLDMDSHCALVTGPVDSPLWLTTTVADVVNDQATKFGLKDLAVFPWQGVRLSYSRLAERGRLVARALLYSGVKPFDCVAILAGNRFEYLEVVVGGAMIGCSVLVLQTTYKPWELYNALEKTKCRALFIASIIGSRNMNEHIELLSSTATRSSLLGLDRVITFGKKPCVEQPIFNEDYEDFLSSAPETAKSYGLYDAAAASVKPSDIASLQFTSGTTGAAKASMLTHINILNNARFVGQNLRLTPDDNICCPPPLFHCFGLVMGFLASLIHGCTIVFPSDHFDANLVLDSIVSEKCTAIYGVPTMFIAELEANQIQKRNIHSLRKGLAAGSTVALTLMNKLKEQLGIETMLIAYGMTETSPVTFMSSFEDPVEMRVRTVGRVMPYTTARIVNKAGQILGTKQRGELCSSGYALQRGYLDDEERTNDVMKKDENGVVWMHTGDEAMIDDLGYCHITGRIKDIIIRGGENIFPNEIEERLLAHPSIAEVCVIGTPDPKYGEVVGCFLKASEGSNCRPGLQEIQDWVMLTMGWSRTPQVVFWVGGDDGICLDFPKTGSGKHQKHLLRELAAGYCKSHSVGIRSEV